MKEKIKIISYNIHKGRSFSGKNIIKEIKEFLSEYHSDLVFLQEVQGKSPEIKEAQFEFLADSLWSHFSYGKNAIKSNSDHGNAILSKNPIIFWENSDISSSKFEKRGVLFCKIKLESLKEINLFCVHLSLLKKDRMKQVEFLIKKIKENTKDIDRIIIAGDFNQWDNSIDQILLKELGMKNSFSSIQNKQSSFPSFFPLFKLDKVFYKNLKLVDSKIISKNWKNSSDHLPLFVEFEIE